MWTITRKRFPIQNAKTEIRIPTRIDNRCTYNHTPSDPYQVFRRTDSRRGRRKPFRRNEISETCRRGRSLQRTCAAPNAARIVASRFHGTTREKLRTFGADGAAAGGVREAKKTCGLEHGSRIAGTLKVPDEIRLWREGGGRNAGIRPGRSDRVG